MTTRDQSMYRHVLADAWTLAWKRRALWPFAFFAALVTTGGIVDFLMRGGNGIFNAEVARLSGGASGSFGQLITLVAPKAMVSPPGWLILAAVLGFVILAALVWVALTCQGALIAGITAVDKHADPRKALGRGIASFWPLFGTALLTRLALGIVTVAATAPFGAAIADRNPGTLLIYICAYVAFVLVSTAVSVLSMYAAIDVVATGSSLWHGLGNAVRTFRAHWIVSFEAALVVFGVDVFVAVGLLIGVVLLLVPFTLFLLMMQVVGTVAGMWIFFTLFIALLVGWIIALASFATTLRYAVWTLLYERLQGRTATAKIVRLLRAIPAILREASRQGGI